MRRAPRVEKICTVCNEIGDIGDSMKGSSSPMKNKVGAQKGALIKMKQENMYTYQWLYRLCYVPIIAPVYQKKHLCFLCDRPNKILIVLTVRYIINLCTIYKSKMYVASLNVNGASTQMTIAYAVKNYFFNVM